MKYIITSTDLRCTDPALYNDCKSFMDPLQGIRSGMTKKVNKESAQTRHAFFPLTLYIVLILSLKFWLISHFGRFASRELHFNDKSTF